MLCILYKIVDSVYGLRVNLPDSISLTIGKVQRVWKIIHLLTFKQTLLIQCPL